MQRSFFCIIAFWIAVTASRAAAAHPLEPLSTNELRSAVEILRQESRVTTNSSFPMVVLR